MGVTPGVRFLITAGIPALLGPPVLVHAFLIPFSHFVPTFTITPIILTCTYLFSFPLYVFLSTRASILREIWGAYRLGARVMPKMEGVLPGNIDLLYKGFSADKSEYLGELWLAPTRNLGTTFAIRILRDQRLCTLNPKNIQKILATDFEIYRKGRLFNDITESMLGVGLFNSDGDMWQFHRKSSLTLLQFVLGADALCQ
jgi:hypothetical protein